MRNEKFGLPKLTEQIKYSIIGKTIATLTMGKHKAFNMPAVAYEEKLIGQSIVGISQQRNWLVIELSNGYHVALSFNLGSDVHYFESNEIKAQKYKPNVTLYFTDHSGFTIRFWWFEEFILSNPINLMERIKAQEERLHPLSTSFSIEYFKGILQGKKTQIKPFLLSQKKISNMSGMYLHDILFNAGIHPTRKIADLTEIETEKLYESIRERIYFYEEKINFFTPENPFDGEGDDFIIAYKDNGEPCPKCNAPIQRFKAGASLSYICENCQPQFSQV